MAPPRISRLASRKSHALDPDLYDSPSNQDSDLSTIITNNNTQNNSKSNKSSRLNSESTTTTTTVLPAKRRSNRLSNESNSTSNDSPAPNFVIAKHRPTTNNNKLNKSPATTKTTKSKKGKEVKSTSNIIPKSRSRGEREAEEEDDEDEEEEEETIIKETKDEIILNKSISGIDKNKKVKLNTESSSSGSRFVPRAAEMLGKPVKAQPKYDHVLEDGEDVGFTYTTNPPTPAPPIRTKRVATQPKENPRQKNLRTITTNSNFSESDASPSHPIQSTSRLSPDFSPARGSNTMAPIYTAETPKQMRNLALRGQGTASGTPGSAGRRGSVDRNRGKRASQIGNGQEALPHPDVKNDTFFRLLDPIDPYTHRMRSLIRWTSHRQRDVLFPPSTTTLSKDKLLAKEIIDEFISGVALKTISVNAEPSRDSRASSVLDSVLAVHQGNGRNRELFKHLVEDFDEIEIEDSQRQEVISHYDKFLSDHHNSVALNANIIPIEKLEISIEDSFAGPSSLEEAIALGKALLAGDGDLKKGYRKLGIVPSNNNSSKKGKGKEVLGVNDTLSEEEVLKEQLNAVPLQSAHFKLLTHRLSTFTHLSSSYIQTRVQQTHQALTDTSQSGLITFTTATNNNNNNPVNNNNTNDLEYRSGIANVIKNFSGISRSGNSSNSRATTTTVNQSMDMRDLLRAIVSADLKSSGTSGSSSSRSR